MKLVKPKAILFDWDNTLVSTWPIIHKALNETFKEMGKEVWSFEETKEKVSHSARDNFPKIFGEKSEEAIVIYRKHYRTFSETSEYDTLEGVLELLNYLREQGIYLAVVSNKLGEILRPEVERIGLHEYFIKVVGSFDALRDKPFPDPAFLALEGSNIHPGDHVWFIGDTFADIECAHNAGFKAVLIGEYNSKLMPREPHLVINNHKELLDLIKSCENN
ncbi:MAG: HAD family hydrolase [Sphingobacteriia bacterium]|nr:HAD family hydrolase [Sphingobacteriia bacterium]